MTAVLTGLTLVAFAANSLLCRMALGGQLVDPVSFTSIRLVGGALVLLPLARLAADRERPYRAGGSWGAAIALFGYAAAFSLAYVSLTTGMGALILFGAVQVTMMSAAVRAGERWRLVQWTGLALAIGGLVYLVSPGIAAPDALGALLMAVSGVAWGVYSIRGRGVSAPVAVTAGNFLRTVPLAIGASALAVAGSRVHLQWPGMALAFVSGALTSALGYILWYTLLPRLTTSQASVVQLLVPVLASVGGVVFLAERVTTRLVSASVVILGGVALAVLSAGHGPRRATS